MGEYDYLLELYPNNIPVAEAAKVMGKPACFVQYGLENGTLPFGCCVKNKQCAFHIAPVAFVRYMEGSRELPLRDLIDAVAEKTAKETVREMNQQKKES